MDFWPARAGSPDLLGFRITARATLSLGDLLFAGVDAGLGTASFTESIEEISERTVQIGAETFLVEEFRRGHLETWDTVARGGFLLGMGLNLGSGWSLDLGLHCGLESVGSRTGGTLGASALLGLERGSLSLNLHLGYAGSLGEATRDHITLGIGAGLCLGS